jgi:hypothetical protein
MAKKKRRPRPCAFPRLCSLLAAAPLFAWLISLSDRRCRQRYFGRKPRREGNRVVVERGSAGEWVAAEGGEIAKPQTWTLFVKARLFRGFSIYNWKEKSLYSLFKIYAPILSRLMARGMVICYV